MTPPDKPPYQFGLANLLMAMFFFGAALGIGVMAYQMQNKIPPYLLLGLSYGLGGAGIGALDRKIVAGAVCGLLVWISLPFLQFVL